ncbi:hydroxyacid dehydrogenase [Candidimonas nitroreducens]|uniref:hydroxyacid dehydrogenase n=1 Tax=Candidimonas nitroreducens TaxID=683354 RepID=UPI001E3D4E2D|nr:hydroxyacid dehydrogenase [Candidimonas nitroreducens]
MIYVLDAFEPSGLQYLADQNQSFVPFGDPRGINWHQDAVGIMIRGSQLSADDFARARKLKVVSKQGVGVDNIALSAAREHGVIVCNTPGINSAAVAELAFTLAMAVARRVSEFDRMIRSGSKIVRPRYLGRAMHGKTIGFIGMGNIGTQAARLFRGAFDCRILAYDPYAPMGHWGDIPHVRIADLEELWPQVDVLSLHVPLTDTTRNIVDRAAIARMKPSAIIINVSRGGLIDELALADALRDGKLFGAGLDAFEEGEPPSRSNPLLAFPNVLATPHAGAGTIETQADSSLATARQLLHVLAGNEPFHRVV